MTNINTHSEVYLYEGNEITFAAIPPDSEYICQKINANAVIQIEPPKALYLSDSRIHRQSKLDFMQR